MNIRRALFLARLTMRTSTATAATIIIIVIIRLTVWERKYVTGVGVHRIIIITKIILCYPETPRARADLDPPPHHWTSFLFGYVPCGTDRPVFRVGTAEYDDVYHSCIRHCSGGGGGVSTVILSCFLAFFDFIFSWKWYILWRTRTCKL